MVRAFYPQNHQHNIRTNTNYPPQGEEGIDKGLVDMLFENSTIKMQFENTTTIMEFE